MTDDLFRPTIEDRATVTSPPWRPQSILYPAFFGGPLAGTVLGLLNGRRLRLATGPMLAIAAAGAAAIVARFLVTSALDGRTSARLIGATAGVARVGRRRSVQKRPFRVYEIGGGEPASLVGAGFAAAIGCGILEAVVLLLADPRDPRRSDLTHDRRESRTVDRRCDRLERARMLLMADRPEQALAELAALPGGRGDQSPRPSTCAPPR